MAYKININLNNMILITTYLTLIIGLIKVNGQCGGDLQGLLTQCATFVQKPGPITDPTQGCCNVIKTIDVNCVCRNIPKQAQDMISMPKAMHCLQFCGKPLAPGSKCGGYTVPPAMNETGLN